MSSRISIRDQIAARRAEARSPAPKQSATFPSRGPSTVEALEETTVEGQIQRAVKSGKLDYSSLRFQRLPPATYTKLLGIPSSDLSAPPSPPQTTNPLSSTLAPRPPLDDNLLSTSSSGLSRDQEREQVFGSKARSAKEDVWLEPEELTSFKAVDCGIHRIEIEFGAFGGLKLVNLRGNGLSSLPDSFADLLRVTSLDLSHNSFTAIPPSTLLLPVLQQFDLSHNALSSIDLSSPISPSDDGLAYGAGFLSTSFSRADKTTRKVWPSLSSINLGFNRITVEGLRFSVPLAGITSVNLESNAVAGILDVEAAGLGKDNMPRLTSLNLSNNPLTGVTGDLARDTKTDTTGCRIGQVVQAKTESSTTIQAAAPIKPSLPAGIEANPPPTLTLTYRTCPAATFDSEPLPIEFDLYLPTVPAGPEGHPLVIWWHGGGLLQGNKENLPPHFRRLPTHSFGSTHVAVISPNYRLAPQAPVLDILSDGTALMNFVREKLNSKLDKDHQIDTSRICLSGGSAGGYLALIAGLPVPSKVSDEAVGGYRGESGIKCIAPFYPITDLTDKFWATETNPVPWWNGSVPHAAAKPHLNTKSPPIASAVSGGPRSILYPYMLQHGLFPSLLFQNQRSIGHGLDAFRPTPQSLSIPDRLNLLNGERIPPVYLIYGTDDQAVNPFERTVDALKRAGTASVVVEVRPGEGHAFDEDEREECVEFREWLGRTLI